MKGKQKLAAALMTILTGIAIYLFFAFKYPYHLHFQEQYQLFEWTGAYFAQVAWAPGGLADWLGRCITQFFYYAPLGAALTAVLLCGVQLLVWTVCRQRSLVVYALSFMPVLLLVAFCCDENALVGSVVSLALSLGAAALCRRIASRKGRRVLELVLVPVLYLACGPLCRGFVLVSVCREVAGKAGKPWLFALGMLPVVVLCPLIASRIFPYPLDRLVQGIHYYRYYNILPGLLYGAALATVLVVLASCLTVRKPLRSMIPAVVLYVVLLAAGTFFTFRTADPVKEEWMHYDFMVRMQMWNRIMMRADQQNPDNPKTVSCLNLALAKTGRMADHQFDYFQNGPDGLLPGFEGDCTNPVSTGEIFWQLGMVNTAQRYVFEAQEAIPDFQKSARFYQHLAETKLVNGDTAVARKYLKALRHTLFYRHWADETEALLDADELFNKRPELARVRDCRLKEHDFLFSETEMDSMLGLLKVENPKNNLSLTYLLSWCLLRKDLDRFAECITLLEKAPVMPKSYQEALLLRWTLTHSDFEGLPSYLSRGYAQRISHFIADAQAGKPEAEMQRAYGDTYWFYYYYRYRTRPE